MQGAIAFLTLLFFYATLVASYQITITCPLKTCIVNEKTCYNCVFLNGGPFDNYADCADSDSSKKQLCYSSLAFSCDSSCIGESFYDLSMPLVGLYLQGCTKNTDTHWNNLNPNTLGIKQILDLSYSVYSNGGSYDWSGKGCWLTVGSLVGIIIGAVAVAIVLTIGIVYRHRKLVRRRIDQEIHSNLLKK